MKFKIIFIILSLAIYSCHAQKKCGNCGIVGVKLNLFDSLKNEFVYYPLFWPERKIWYKEDYAIEEISIVNHEKNNLGHDTARIQIKCYTFIDLNAKSFYDYASFSDTAILLKKYTQADSIAIPGGWNFYFDEGMAVTYPPQVLNDTIIENITYKRIKFITKKFEGQEDKINIGYLRCDKKGTKFQFFKNFSQKQGCQMTKVEWWALPRRFGTGLSEIEFVSDTLTREELKVFDAWERNARKYPVNK